VIDGVDLAQKIAGLGQNYPNPFSGSTLIDYELAVGSHVGFEIRDITGRLVLEQNLGFQPAGRHTFSLTSADLESGLYMYTIRAGNFTESRRMTICR
jgi:hypothetical protein